MAAERTCPMCLKDRDVEAPKTVMVCCSKTVCAKCAERLHASRMPCPLCKTPFPADDDETLAMLLRHVDAGNPAAICHLGHAYAHGALGVGRSDAEAADHFKRAADLGDAGAMADYADHCRGVTGDLAEAAAYYRRAADAGDARAQFALGDLYDNGEGVPHDPKRALRYYTLAADQGHTSAEFNVGSIHENGDGVSRDVAAARRWFERAAAKGHDKAAALLSFLEQQGD